MSKISVEEFPSYIVDKLSPSEIIKFNNFFNSQEIIAIYDEIVFNKKKNIFTLFIIGVIIGIVVYYLAYLANNLSDIWIMLIITIIGGISCTIVFFPKLFIYNYDTEKLLPNFVKIFLPNGNFSKKSVHAEANFELFRITKLLNSSIHDIEYVNNSISNTFVLGDKEIDFLGFEAKTIGKIGSKNYFTSNYGYFTKIVYKKTLSTVDKPIWLLNKSDSVLTKVRNKINGFSQIKINDEDLKTAFDIYCHDSNYFKQIIDNKFILSIKKYINNNKFFKAPENSDNYLIKNSHEMFIMADSIYIKNNYLVNNIHKGFFNHSYLNKPEIIFIGCLKYYIEVKNNINLAKDLSYLFYNDK